MKNAELYFHIEHLAKKSILPEVEKHQDIARKKNPSPHLTIELAQVEVDAASGLIEIQIQATALDHVSTSAIQRAFHSIIEMIDFGNLLPEQLKAFQFDPSSIHCHSNKLEEMCKEAQRHQEYDEHEVWVGYKHTLTYKLPPKADKEMLKAIKDDLKALKKLAAKEKNTVRAMTSINFQLEYQGKTRYCSLNKLTQKLGFAHSYDEKGNRLEAHNLTWDAWRSPTADLRDLFKGIHTSTALKAILKGHLAKDVKITALTTTCFKFVDNYSFYGSHKLISLYANIGDYREPVLTIINIRKSGEIVIMDERGVDITTTNKKAANMVNWLKTVHEDLFCSNKRFAKKVLSFNNLTFYHMAFS